ncbi:MAG: hypothetical protein ACE5SW_06695 [Nitrososphaeraceae archaeon]
MSEIKNSTQTVQDLKKPHLYEVNDLNMKNVLNQITNTTNTQRQILKKLDEESSNHSKLEKILSGIKNDLKEIIRSAQNNNVNIKRDIDSVKQIKTKISEIQSQLKEVRNAMTTLNQLKQENQSKEEKRKNKELKREEKRKNKELKREEKRKNKELKREEKRKNKELKRETNKKKENKNYRMGRKSIKK